MCQICIKWIQCSFVYVGDHLPSCRLRQTYPNLHLRFLRKSLQENKWRKKINMRADRVFWEEYTSVSIFIYLSICLSVCLSIYLCVFLSFYLSVCVSVYLSIFLSFYLSVCVSDCLSILSTTFSSISILPNLPIISKN